MITDPSAILFICTSLKESVLFFLLKEAHFMLDRYFLAARCAIRGHLDHQFWQVALTGFRQMRAVAQPAEVPDASHACIRLVGRDQPLLRRHSWAIAPTDLTILLALRALLPHLLQGLDLRQLAQRAAGIF